MASFVPTDLTSLEKEVGHCIVGNFPLNFSEKIDEGTSGTIYKYTLRDKPTAVKLFKKQMSRRRMLQVAARLRKLKHPNIIRFRGVSCQLSALLFEFCSVDVQDCSVHNISQLISIFNENSYHIFKERLGYIIQATHGLKFLHENGIIHKDYKPTNLLVNGTLENIIIKVADFDDMLVIKETISATVTTHQFAGVTLFYTAPEICNHTVSKPTFKSDIFSWAITAYEILTNVASPWSDVLPKLCDTLLIQALNEGKRPCTNTTKALYNKDKNSINKLCALIENGWDTCAANRSSIDEVYIYIYIFFLL